ncbi:mitogen-activated protein kinase kinase kinase, partial [Tremellales sp. Uapishka_1]
MSRSITYATPTSSAAAPPPAPQTPSLHMGPNSYREWKNRYRGVQRTTSMKNGSKSAQQGIGMVGGFPGRGSVDFNDPDVNYFHHTRQLEDWGSDNEETVSNRGPDVRSPAVPVKEMMEDAVRQAIRPVEENDCISPNGVNLGRTGVGQPKSLILATPPPGVASETRERLEWQTMLASVLGGEILKGESSRIGPEKTGDEAFRREMGRAMWWQIRAKMRGRTEEEERRMVLDRRGRVVDAVLEEIEGFVVKSNMATTRRLSSEDTSLQPNRPPESESSALDQVTSILHKLSLVESLYPTQQSVRVDKPLYATAEFQARVDALAAWSTVVTSLQAQLHVLQKWTGSDDLDITKPNTTKERALVGKSRYHPLDAKAKAQAQLAGDQAADDSTFVERVLKEDNLQKTFEKRAFVDMLSLVMNAKETVISHLPIFQELKLPDFQYELVRLIGFPGRLIIEALKVRLDAAAKLVDPNVMVIDDMIDNFRLSISLAVLIKRQYENITAPDPEDRWTIPSCLAPDYNAVLLDGLRTFFKLLHWKLKSGSKAIYFRETEVLEDEWEFLYEAAEAVEGGDLVVAEHFCSLTNKLMVRVINYFETQLHVPIGADASPSAVNKSLANLRAHHHPAEAGKHSRDRKLMTTEEMLSWFSKILDAVKMRYRKRLTARFDNSAEYLLEDEDLDVFIDRLQQSGHFLVYTRVFEERGTYIFADGALWNNPSEVEEILRRSFSTIPGRSRHLHEITREAHLDGDLPEMSLDGSEEEDVAATYLLLVSPRQNFAWTGAVMTLDLPYTDFALEDNRIRLVADGPMSRLALCKDLFAESFDESEGEPAFQLECVVEQQAHVPRVQKELKKIARSTHRLSECIVESAAHVRRTLRGAPGTQELTQNWYSFASNHGHKVGVHMDHASWSRFSQLLMRLAISWVSFICDNCDPTDKRTFRWTITSLHYAMLMTRGNNILHLDKGEFALLRAKVANCMALLISHFDILGARSSIEAKKEAERLETVRRLQRLQENFEDDDMLPRTPSPSGQVHVQIDRSIRLVREERLRLIHELEQHRIGLFNDQRIIGQVLDEEVAEDRSLVFLAASTSNIALRWQQGGFIGGGANGNVYIGFNLDSGGIMAVKEIRVQDLSNSPALYKQIKDESDVMQMLSHPNIVDYYGIEVHRDRVYIFEEYCEGGSLANLLEHGRVEDEEVVMVYALQMLQGLEYLHSKGVEHRDVKPDNILLATGQVIKYVDFGAAKVIAKGNRTMAKTRAQKTKVNPVDGAMNSLAGTPMYMAPEVIKNERASRLGSMDICRKPWSNLDNEWAIMFHIGIATQHPPLPEPGQLSELGIDFIEQCLCLDPAERPTASELLFHPWLAPMVQQMAEHQVHDYSPGIPSLTSTLVENYDATYAAQIAQMAKLSTPPAEDMASFSSTPMEGSIEGTPPSVV